MAGVELKAGEKEISHSEQQREKHARQGTQLRKSDGRKERQRCDGERRIDLALRRQGLMMKQGMDRVGLKLDARHTPGRDRRAVKVHLVQGIHHTHQHDLALESPGGHIALHHIHEGVCGKRVGSADIIDQHSAVGIGARLILNL